MKTRKSDKIGRQGFTLIELMITTSIVGILSAVAVPSFQKYILDAKEVEGTRMLLEALRDQRRVATECSVGRFINPSTGESTCKGGLDFTELQGAQDSFYPTLMYKPSSRANFRLITGNMDRDLDVVVGPVFSSDGQPVNDLPFGYMLNSSGGSGTVVDKNHFLMGASAEIFGKRHVLAVEENGVLHRMCDAITGPVQEGLGLYRSFTGVDVSCDDNSTSTAQTQTGDQSAD